VSLSSTPDRLRSNVVNIQRSSRGLLLIAQNNILVELEIRSVERGICGLPHTATSTMNELFLSLWPDAWRMHETAIFLLPV